MSLRVIWKEFQRDIGDLKIKHDVAEASIKAMADKMTAEDFECPMNPELETMWKIQEGMGGIRKMRISYYVLCRYWKVKRDERKNKRL